MVDTTDGLIKSHIKVLADELGCKDENLDSVWKLVYDWGVAKNADELLEEIETAMEVVNGGRDK